MYSLHRKTIAASLAAAAIAGGLTLAGSVATAPAAEAALPIVGAGDILLPTDGSFTSGSGVDKLDPVTRVRSRAATLGGSVTQLVAAAPNGDFFMADRDIRIVKVDDVTGNQTTIKAPEFNTSNLVDLVVAADGNLIGLLLEASGNRLVRINAVTGAVTTLSSSGLLDPAGQSEFNEVAIEHDGRVLVSYGTRLLRVDPTTGAQTTVATFPSIVRGLAVRSDSQIFVRVDNISTTPERLVKVNPQTGAQTTVSSGGVLTSLANQGLAFENGTHIVSAEGGSFGAGSVVRINTFTGNQDRLIQLGEGENNNIAVAGVNQIPPTPLPKAGNDIFSMDGSTGELQAGVLGNDSDPLGQKLTAEQVSQPSHGFTSFNADGSFFYFPDTGFVGTDTFTYRTVAADGRKSAPATVTVNVLPAQAPVARDDFFNTQGTATSTQYSFNGQSVLDNDSDPQSDQLVATILTQPSVGQVALNNDGTLSLLTPVGFSGQVSFTYQAGDGSNKDSATATLQIAAAPVNTPPIVEVRPGGTIKATGLGGTMNLFVADGQTAAGSLGIAKSSSNTALVPVGNVTLGGTGSQRTLTVTPVAGKTGTAVITIKVTDGAGVSKSVAIQIKVGGSSADILSGTSGADMLFGLGGNDTLKGLAGNDVIGGGAGNDTMTGGTGADTFRGGAGTNTVSDFNASQGDKATEAKTS